MTTRKTRKPRKTKKTRKTRKTRKTKPGNAGTHFDARPATPPSGRPSCSTVVADSRNNRTAQSVADLWQGCGKNRKHPCRLERQRLLSTKHMWPRRSQHHAAYPPSTTTLAPNHVLAPVSDWSGFMNNKSSGFVTNTWVVSVSNLVMDH